MIDDDEGAAARALVLLAAARDAGTVPEAATMRVLTFHADAALGVEQQLSLFRSLVRAVRVLKCRDATLLARDDARERAELLLCLLVGGSGLAVAA